MPPCAWVVDLQESLSQQQDHLIACSLTYVSHQSPSCSPFPPHTEPEQYRIPPGTWCVVADLALLSHPLGGRTEVMLMLLFFFLKPIRKYDMKLKFPLTILPLSSSMMRSPSKSRADMGQRDKVHLWRARCAIGELRASDRGSSGVKYPAGSCWGPDVINSYPAGSVGEILPYAFLVCVCSPTFLPKMLQNNLHRHVSVMQIPARQLDCGKYQFHDQLIYKSLFVFQ